MFRERKKVKGKGKEIRDSEGKVPMKGESEKEIKSQERTLFVFSYICILGVCSSI